MKQSIEKKASTDKYFLKRLNDDIFFTHTDNFVIKLLEISTRKKFFWKKVVDMGSNTIVS